MPQMYPMNWLFLFLFLLSCVFFTLSMINTTLMVVCPKVVLSPNVSHSSWTW